MEQQISRMADTSDRRDFLRLAGAGAASLLVGGLAPQRAGAQCPYTYEQFNEAVGFAINKWDSTGARGSLINAVIDPDYLGNSVGWGEVVIATAEIPGLGEVVITVTVLALTATAIYNLFEWAVAKGKYDPVQVRKPVSPILGTRDPNGNCDPTPPTPDYKWQAINSTGANAGQIHWHYSYWNQNPYTYQWNLSRHNQSPSGDPGPAYQLIPGIFRAPS